MRPSLMISSTWLTLISILLLASGCQQKTVTIRTNADGAEITITRVEHGVVATNFDKKGPAPLTASLSFAEGISYHVVASKYQYHDAKATINWEPKEQTIYEMAMEQYLKSVDTTAFELQFGDTRSSGQRSRLLHLVATNKTTEAYIDTKETAPAARNCVPLPSSRENELAGLISVAASPVDNWLAYMVVTDVQPEKLHTVDKNETLAQVAERYGLTGAELRKMNDLGPEPLTQGQLLKVTEQEIQSRIVKRPITGSASTPLTPGNTLDLFPAFDYQNSIVFSSNRVSANPMNFGLWLVRSGAGAMSRVTNPQSQEYGPSVGKDSTIAFSAMSPGAGTPEIWTVGVKGNDLTQLSSNGEWPQICPDNKRILFIRRYSPAHASLREKLNGPGQLWSMAIDGTDEKQLTHNTDYTITGARWSDDGNWIVYAADESKDQRGVPNFDLWVVGATKNNEGIKIQLTQNGSWDDSPCWGRDGNIYFRSNRGGAWRIWRLEPVLPALAE